MRVLRIISGFMIMLIVTAQALAQAGATGSILGTVTDASGALLPQAKVVVQNVATGVAFNTITSSSGDFLAPSLIPGSYTVRVEAPGFQTSLASGLTLTVDQKIRVNLTLKPGAVTETVQVSTQGIALDTDSTAVSQLMSQHQVEQLPLSGRNFMQLLTVTAGAVTTGGEQGTMRQGMGNAVSINGGRPEGNNYTLDGLVNTDPALVTPAVILSQDAIQEFKVESGTYSAEYGFSANQINIVSKSGTNALHGAIFEFNRNNAYDANPFPTATDYSLGKATSKPVLHQNQFGFVMDGPVYIPKLYDGRNKTFWMANYEGWRINNGVRLSASVPNPAVLTGDFSTEKTSTGAPLPPYGSAACAALLKVNQNCMPVDPTTGNSFPNNQIPASAITNHLAQVAIKNGYWPSPTQQNQPEGVPNFIQTVGLPLTTNQQTYRIDQSLGRFGSLFARGTYATFHNSTLKTASLTYGLLTQFETEKSWTVSHTLSLGGANLNNFRFGYLGSQAPQGGPAPTQDAVNMLALSGVFTHFGPNQETWPNLGMSQYSTAGGPAPTGSDSHSWEFADSFSMVRGKHSISFGADYRRWHLVRNLDNNFLGAWTFNASTILSNSNGCPNPAVSVNGAAATTLCGTGNAIADLMLGYYGTAGGFMPGPLSPTDIAGNSQDHVFNYLAPYVQDAWKPTDKLTITAGLRWDYRAAPYEASNKFFWLDDRNPAGGLCYADPQLATNGVAPGAGVNGSTILRYCGHVPRSGSKMPFAPRFGVNYRLTDRTVARAGYGIFFDSTEGREIDNSGDIYPYSIRLNENPTGDPTLPKFGNQLFPNFSKLTPFPVQSLSFVAVIQSNSPKNPYVQSWTLSIERELAQNTTLEINYIGTKSTHLLDRLNIAQPNAITATNLPFCQASPNDVSHNCPTYTRLPYPNFTGSFINSVYRGYSNYNSLNANLQHRAGNSALTAIYTWAKSLDDKSAAAAVGASTGGWQGFADNHNPDLDYGPSDFNVNQRFVATYVYQLPFGRGQRFLGSVNRAVDAVVGGWQIAGISTFQSGFPFSMTATDAAGLTGTQFQRANYVPGCDVHANLTKRFQRINTACYTQPAAGTFGNSGRNSLRQPGISNWDIGLSKDFRIAERIAFGLRFDTFNTFNHHQYAVSVGGLATGGSGGASAIQNTVGNALAGQMTAAGSPRTIQLSGKLHF